MAGPYTLKKAYQNFFGLDFKSNDLVRGTEFASDMKNAQFRKSGAIEKRKGYQVKADGAATQGGFGLFSYLKKDPTTGADEKEVLALSDSLFKKQDTTLEVKYTGAESTSIDIFYDTATSQYRLQILEGVTQVLDSALGLGFDEASIKTIDTLRGEIAALTDWDAQLGGAAVTTTPAAFLCIKREFTGTLTTFTELSKASILLEANKTITTNPFAGSETNKNDSDFENVSGVQLSNNMYFANGYDNLMKYDGQTFYRAGLPDPDDQDVNFAISDGGAGTLTGTYKYRIQFKQIDDAGVVTEANITLEENAPSLVHAAKLTDLDIPYVLHGSGFNTNCGIVAGAQTSATITVDDGAGGAIDAEKRLRAGDTGYFLADNEATVDGAQVGVTIVTVDSGHNLTPGQRVVFTDQIGVVLTTRSVLNTTDTTFEITGSAVDLLDNQEISAYAEVSIVSTTSTSVTFSRSVKVADNAPISNNLRVVIYRTEGTGTTFKFLQEIANDAFDVTTYTDNFGDDSDDLGSDLVQPLTDRSLPPKGKYVTAFLNQMFISGNIESPYTVFFSEPESSPEYFDLVGLSGQFDVQSIQGDIITGLGPNNNVLAIFAEKSISTLTGSVATKAFKVDLITNDIGCIAHATIRDVSGSLYFLDRRGPHLMFGGQVPTPVGGNRIEPLFDQPGVDLEKVFQLKRATAVNFRDDEKYILFLPTETTSAASEVYSNSDSTLFVHDYSRDAWLKWDSMDMSGGSTVLDGELFWVSRELSAFAPTGVKHRLFQQHNLNDAWDYQDNNTSIDFQYKSQWESLGEASVLKRFNRLRLFSLEELINNNLNIDVETEVNFVEEAPSASFSINIPQDGYGVSEFGNAPYGDPNQPTFKTRLSAGRFRSLRIIYKNSNNQENISITGWEFEIATPFKAQFKD